ncbi:P-loop NTPase [bacterium]|nr:P-loop NTPase [candidate division CSSED10-310 bacterium]
MGFGDLFEKRLIMVTGKGGVGKSTIAAAIALEAAQRGLHTVLLSIETGDTLRRMVTSEGRLELPETLFLQDLQRQDVLDDFVRKLVKVKTLSATILNSPLYRTLTAVAPGFRELLILNHLFELERKGSALKRRRRTYDLIVLDAPATGHGASYLEVPLAVLKSIKVGPLKARAQRIRDLLQDSQRCGILLVTLAEEMPVSEAIEFHERAVEKLRYPILGILVNAIYPNVLRATGELENLLTMFDDQRFRRFMRGNYPDSFLKELEEQIRFCCARHHLNQVYRAKLTRCFSEEVIEIPFFAALNGTESVCDQVRETLFTSRDETARSMTAMAERL